MSERASEEDRLRSRLRDLRVFEGELPGFDPHDVPFQPDDLFLRWLVQAIEAGVREPHAMTLSTIDTDGRPSSRVLILKGIADGQWEFATSRTSRKGRELDGTPWAAANFYWREVGRQVRLRGRVLDGGPEAAARDFLARSAGSRSESLLGHQSEILDDPADLDLALEEAQVQIAADPKRIPEHWTLYRLAPDEVEFWQADVERRHVRLQYTLGGDGWNRRLLWP